jgi:hypothetical protein
MQTQVDEADNDDLVVKLLLVYRAGPKPEDLSALNRHGIRLLRYARALSSQARESLRKELSVRLEGRQRMKFAFYSTLAKLGFS